jgi:predicted RecA/RadA family phage recombinase
MQNKISKGAVLTVPAPTGGIASGAAALVGKIFGVAITTEIEGADVALDTEGVYELPKATGAAWAFGDALYWDATAKKLTVTASGNTRVAVAVAVAASGDTVGLAKINSNI